MISLSTDCRSTSKRRAKPEATGNLHHIVMDWFYLCPMCYLFSNKDWDQKDRGRGILLCRHPTLQKLLHFPRLHCANSYLKPALVAGAVYGLYVWECEFFLTQITRCFGSVIKLNFAASHCLVLFLPVPSSLTAVHGGFFSWHQEITDHLILTRKHSYQNYFFFPHII